MVSNIGLFAGGYLLVFHRAETTGTEWATVAAVWLVPVLAMVIHERART
jgi:hypothetical protein